MQLPGILPDDECARLIEWATSLRESLKVERELAQQEEQDPEFRMPEIPPAPKCVEYPLVELPKLSEYLKTKENQKRISRILDLDLAFCPHAKTLRIAVNPHVMTGCSCNHCSKQLKAA